MAAITPASGLENMLGGQQPELKLQGGIQFDDFKKTDSATSAESMPFENAMKAAFSHANQTSIEANKMASSFAAGTNDDIHGTMIASQKAAIEVKLVATVRNKLVDAFYDLWRMNL